MYSDWNEGFWEGTFLAFLLMGIMTFIVFFAFADIVPYDKRELCEKDLPRSEKCVWISVPESEANKEDILSPPDVKE